MIAKMIIKSWDRGSATSALSEQLGQSIVAGIPSNIGFLKRCLDNEVFRQGDHHVNWIAEEIDALASPDTDGAKLAASLVAGILLSPDDNGPWDEKDGWRMNAAPRRSIRLLVGEDIVEASPGDVHLTDDWQAIGLSETRFAVGVNGETWLVEVPDYEAEAEAIAGGDRVSAPMPGKVIDLRVKAGDNVTKDQTVAVMEAMKMEHSLKAPRDGVVKTVGAELGEQVGEGVVLVELEDA